MSGIPYKLDGLGKMGAAGTSRVENREKFVAMYASETIAKGDAVAFDLHATEPTHGYGNHVRVADTDDTSGAGSEAGNMNAIGIATEAASSGDVLQIQVGGVCDFAKLVVASCAPGDILGQAATDGSLQVLGADTTLAVAINIKEGTNVTADSQVFLLNPANL